ncbi:MAG: hypothetical protein M3Y17_15350 [Actinomycetota bacterium]|nr:hypothetical protein [Actinomycetota bacterium]
MARRIDAVWQPYAEQGGCHDPEHEPQRTELDSREHHGPDGDKDQADVSAAKRSRSTRADRLSQSSPSCGRAAW